MVKSALASYWHLHDKHPDYLRALSRLAASMIPRDDRKAAFGLNPVGETVSLTYDGMGLRLKIHSEADEASFLSQRAARCPRAGLLVHI
jgi:hypothetical protein